VAQGPRRDPAGAKALTTVPVTLTVCGKPVPAGATRSGSGTGTLWTLSAASWPEIRVCGRDVTALKHTLQKRLVAEVRKADREAGRPVRY
jgi:hypothetical protein